MYRGIHKKRDESLLKGHSPTYPSTTEVISKFGSRFRGDTQDSGRIEDK